jgi:hypothetical protein
MGSMKDIYVVMGSSGYPDDRRTWLVMGFTNESFAHEYARTLLERGRMITTEINTKKDTLRSQQGFVDMLDLYAEFVTYVESRQGANGDPKFMPEDFLLNYSVETIGLQHVPE